MADSFQPYELELLRAILGDRIDPTQVGIERRSPTVAEVRSAAGAVGVDISQPDQEIEAAVRGRAMSLPNNTIYVPPTARISKTALDALTVHEVVHQMQYQEDGAAQVFGTLLQEQLSYLLYLQGDQADDSLNPYCYEVNCNRQPIESLSDIIFLEGRAAYIEEFVELYLHLGEPPYPDKARSRARVLQASQIDSPAVKTILA